MQGYERTRVPSFKTYCVILPELFIATLSFSTGYKTLWGKKKKLFSYTGLLYYILVPEQVPMEFIFFMTPNGLHLTQCIRNQNTFHVR